MPADHDNAAIVCRFWDLVWNKGELSAIDDLVDDEFTRLLVHRVSAGSVCLSAETIEHHVRLL